jgi:hypothetical protein
MPAEHSDHVGFGFFEPGIGRSDGFVDGQLLAVLAREDGSQFVGDFMHQRAGHVAFARGFGGLRRGHQELGDGQNHEVDAGIQEVLEEDFLAAFFLVDARVVGQIVGDGLVAVEQVAGAVGGVHHFHGREMAALEGRSAGSSGSASWMAATYFW